MSTLPTFNGETLASGRPNELDLRRVTWTPDIQCERIPDGMYWAWDRAKFDGDPESKWHVYGQGRTKQEAITDLLWGIMEALDEPERQYEQIRGISSGEEPADYKHARYVDPDQE